jgi:hypothetical protein
MIISCSVLLEWEMFQTKVVKKIKTRILYSITFSQKSCGLWDNMEKSCRARQATDDIIIGRMRVACWITKATDTYSVYVILIDFPRQQWLRQRASMLRLFVHCPSCYTIFSCSPSLPALIHLGTSANLRKANTTLIVQQFVSHWMDFHEILCRGLLLKSFEQLHIWLKLGEKIRNLT